MLSNQKEMLKDPAQPLKVKTDALTKISKTLPTQTLKVSQTKPKHLLVQLENETVWAWEVKSEQPGSIAWHVYPEKDVEWLIHQS